MISLVPCFKKSFRFSIVEASPVMTAKPESAPAPFEPQGKTAASFFEQ
jgi:hypothetical protein